MLFIIKIIHAHQRKNGGGGGAKSYSIKQLLLKFVVILSSLFSIHFTHITVIMSYMFPAFVT